MHYKHRLSDAFELNHAVFQSYAKQTDKSYVYWTVHHLDSWIKRNQLDVTCFIISLFTVQHVSSVSTSIFRSLRLIVDLFRVLYCSSSMCVGVAVWFGWGGVVSLCRLKRASACIRTPHTFAKFLKATISFAMSVRPHDTPRLPWFQASATK